MSQIKHRPKLDWQELDDWQESGRLYARIHESRHAIVFPWIAEAIRTANAGTLLDYGGGSGDLIRQLPSGPSLKMSLYDPSPSLLDALSPDVREKLECASTSRGEFEHMTYDVIVFSAVWMCLPSEEACVEALSWMRERLTPRTGQIIFAVTHPCFRQKPYSTFSTTFNEEDYFDSGLPFQVYLRNSHSGVVLTDYHWNLTDMFRQANLAGLVVDDLVELPDVTSEGTGKMLGCPWLVGRLGARQ